MRTGRGGRPTSKVFLEKGEEKMKGLIICYSTTGNTRLVADRIAAELTDKGVKTKVRNPVLESRVDDIGKFDLVGFGTPTMAWKPSFGYCECVGLVPRQPKRVRAFVFCTSGGQPINTLRIMAEGLSKKNFLVLEGLEIAAENNWPVARQFGGAGLGPVGWPDEGELSKVGPFVGRILEKLGTAEPHPADFPFRNSPFHYAGLLAGADRLRLSMGVKRADKKLCVQCAACAQACASRAIALDPYPVFSKRCIGCWACYNVCPTQAITTTVTGGRGRYAGPAARR